MGSQERMIIFFTAVVGFLLLQPQEQNNNFGLTNDDAQAIILVTEEAFDFAEKQVLNKKPEIIPNEVSGPDPDINKCICKGTGKIQQGDGHVTECPYHGNISNESPEQWTDESAQVDDVLEEFKIPLEPEPVPEPLDQTIPEDGFENLPSKEKEKVLRRIFGSRYLV